MDLPQADQPQKVPVNSLPGLFNLRGSDIPYNPFFYSYTLLTDSSIRYGFSLACSLGLLPTSAPHLPHHLPCPNMQPSQEPAACPQQDPLGSLQSAFPDPLTSVPTYSQSGLLGSLVGFL